MPFKSCDDSGGYHLGDIDDGSSGDKVEVRGDKILLELMEMFSTVGRDSEWPACKHWSVEV